MGQQIKVFKKNTADISLPDVTYSSVGSAASVARLAFNRQLGNGWITDGYASDALMASLTVTFGDPREIRDIFLVEHNFKNYTIYTKDDGDADFVSRLVVTNQTLTTVNHDLGLIRSVYAFKIEVTATITADQDKKVAEIILTTTLGQFAGWPVIKDPTFSKNQKKNKALSGKVFTTENAGSFSCTLSVSNWRNVSDLNIVASLYKQRDGFLIWLCGGDDTIFFASPQGYRKKDFYLMKTINDYSPEYVMGIYTNGQNVSIKLEETV